MNELRKAVKEIIEENGGREYAMDVLQHGCVSGVVSELIYYTDTHKWFDTHYEDIMELREEWENMGVEVKPDGDLKNWFAWWSFEVVTSEMY
jgi:hypothetical protein